MMNQEYEKRHRIEEAQKSKEKHSKFLSQTVTKYVSGADSPCISLMQPNLLLGRLMLYHTCNITEYGDWKADQLGNN